MDLKEIEKQVNSYLTQSIAGLDKENPKFDFKRDWYDLSSNQGISEFIKDTSSLANTFGLDGLIVIGFDESTKTFNPSVFKDSKLRDNSEVINLINRKVDRLFEIATYDIVIDGNNLSVIHIPPSIDKPHVIKLHQTFNKDGTVKKEEVNRVFVRKNTQVFPATKYDFELMYYDRKNIIPEYEMFVSANYRAMSINWDENDKLKLTMKISIENTGRRPVAVSSIEFYIEFGEQTGLDKFLLKDENLVVNNAVIRSGEIWHDRINFVADKSSVLPNQQFKNAKIAFYRQEKEKLIYSNLKVKLSNDKELTAPFKIYK